MLKQNNVRIYAEPTRVWDLFAVYLDFSGQRELLLLHRRNGLLFNFLREGVPLAELTSARPGKRSFPVGHPSRTRRKKQDLLQKQLSYLGKRALAYIEQREYRKTSHKAAASVGEAA